MLTTFILTDAIGSILPLAGDGVLDLANQKFGEFQKTLLLAGGMFAVVFVIMQAVSAKGAISRIVVAGIAASIFLWIINNVDFMSGKVDNELNSAPAPVPADVSHTGPSDHS